MTETTQFMKSQYVTHSTQTMSHIQLRQRKQAQIVEQLLDYVTCICEIQISPWLTLLHTETNGSATHPNKITLLT